MEAAEASDRERERREDSRVSGPEGARERETRRDRDPWHRDLGKKENKG